MVWQTSFKMVSPAKRRATPTITLGWRWIVTSASTVPRIPVTTNIISRIHPNTSMVSSLRMGRNLEIVSVLAEQAKSSAKAGGQCVSCLHSLMETRGSHLVSRLLNSILARPLSGTRRSIEGILWSHYTVIGQMSLIPRLPPVSCNLMQVCSETRTFVLAYSSS